MATAIRMKLELWIGQKAIEKADEFPHHRGQRNMGWVVPRNQSLAELSEDGIVTDGAESGHEEPRRTLARPALMVRCPRRDPLSMFIGATPTKEAIWALVRVPSSGNSAIMSVEVVLPTPLTCSIRSFLA
jgi:hypothetical protein